MLGRNRTTDSMVTPDDIEARLVAIEAAAEDIRNAIETTAQVTTAELAKLRGLSQNGVLWAGTLRLGSDGYAELNLTVPAGSLFVDYMPPTNAGAALIIAAASGSTMQPGFGLTTQTTAGMFAGQFRVNPGTARTISVLYQTVGFWGAAGAFVHVELRAGTVNPAGA